MVGAPRRNPGPDEDDAYERDQNPTQKAADDDHQQTGQKNDQSDADDDPESHPLSGKLRRFMNWPVSPTRPSDLRATDLREVLAD